MVTNTPNLVKDTHTVSYAQLSAYINDKQTPDHKYLYANLILDAVTVHKSEFKRINDTLNL
jgi:hypothetical protein